MISSSFDAIFSMSLRVSSTDLPSNFERKPAMSSANQRFVANETRRRDTGRGAKRGTVRSEVHRACKAHRAQAGRDKSYTGRPVNGSHSTAPPLGQRPLAVVGAPQGRASSEAACPSSGCRTPTSSNGPPPAYARGRGAVGGAEPWPQVHPGVVRGARAAAGL